MPRIATLLGWISVAFIALTIISIPVFFVGDKLQVTLLRTIGIYGVLVGVGGLAILRMIFAFKRRPKISTVKREVVGEFEIRGGLLISGNFKLEIPIVCSEFPKGNAQVECSIRTYEDQVVEIDFFRVLGGRRQQGPLNSRMIEELVVETNSVFVVDGDAATRQSSDFFDKQLSEVPTDRASIPFRLLSNESGNFGVVLMPAGGNGAYQVTQVFDENGLLAVECELQHYEENES